VYPVCRQWRTDNNRIKDSLFFIQIMSHKKNVFSPAGTPLLDRTVGELVAERPGRSRIFQSHQIDFCCQGGLTLREACERKRISTDTVIEQLEAESADKVAPVKNPADLPLHELTDYIVRTHHTFLRRELPRLATMSARVAQVHGGHTPSLMNLFDVFQGMQAELESHMIKEEQVLFPTVAAISRKQASAVPLDGPIACMIHEHEDVGTALSKLRELSHGFTPPGDACNTYRALFAGLQDLEEDLHRHIHLENAVLFPAAEALVAQELS
jgi:regulator of cell morphogenesis and NO signaling